MPLAPSLPRTAFIVDDDEMICMAIGLVLKSLGYEVLGVARTAEAALEQIAATRPSFAIIDIHLPDRSGVELAASLLRNEDLPIIFVTGVDDPDMTPLKGSNGVFGFLAKPASRTALRAMVELVRMQAEGRRRLQELEPHYHALFDQAADSTRSTSRREVSSTCTRSSTT